MTPTVARAWERRYGVVEPARTASGYRLYDETAIERLRTMRRLMYPGDVEIGVGVRAEEQKASA